MCLIFCLIITLIFKPLLYANYSFLKAKIITFNCLLQHGVGSFCCLRLWRDRSSSHCLIRILGLNGKCVRSEFWLSDTKDWLLKTGHVVTSVGFGFCLFLGCYATLLLGRLTPLRSVLWLALTREGKLNTMT